MEPPERDEAKDAALRWLATLHPDESPEQIEERLRVTVVRMFGPRTCREAAKFFERWAKAASFKADRKAHQARADIIATFGEAEVPLAILDAWDFKQTFVLPKE